MKKIIIFSTAYLPFQGGAEIAVREITDRLNNFEFYLICARLRRDLPKAEKIGNVNVHRIGFGNNFDKILLPFFGFLQARMIYKLSPTSNRQPLVLWGIMASWGSLAVLFFKFFYPKVPFLLTLQEGDAETYIKKGRMGLISWSWRRLLAKADFLQVISQYLADLARKYDYKRKIEVVPNGVNLNKFQIPNDKFQISTFKKELGIEENDKIIISVSRLVEKNGISDLIDAVSRLLSVDYKLLILGSGPLEGKLKFQASDLKIKDKVIFLGDVPNEKVSEYLAMADVFCRPSLSEGLGNSFLEAMAMGVPIIGTRVGGIPDFLRDPSAGLEQATGLFCEEKNPESIAKALKLLLEDEVLRQKIITNGRKLVEEKYDWEKIAKKMTDIFNIIAI
jgi:glycosyltransferase involved in cell wall biosynthesis